jgi:hypothetical protein
MMGAMLFPFVCGILSLIAAAIVFWGGFAEERRCGDDSATGA